jgi:EAL domain
LEVHYQPVVNLRDDNITGCEALLRWRHPERGKIPPRAWIDGTGVTVGPRSTNWNHRRFSLASPLEMISKHAKLRIAESQIPHLAPHS